MYKLCVPYFRLVQSYIMNIVRNDFNAFLAANIVKTSKIDLFHNICAELHEGFDITNLTINPSEADDDTNTEEDKMSDNHPLTHTQSY